MNTSLYPVVIIAGGLATRLRPLTETIPKSLVDINGEPFIEHQLRQLQANGIKEVVMCLGYLGEQVIDYVGDGSRYGLQVTYALDGPKLLGTAGAIKKALPHVGEHFFVLNGDSYLPCDYAAVQRTFERCQKLGLMTVFHNQGKWDSSNVEYKNDSIVVYDKIHKTERMLHFDDFLESFSRSAIDQVPDDEPYDLAVLFQDLLKNNQLAAHEVNERFYEVGSFAGISELGYYLSLGKDSAAQTETVPTAKNATTEI
jgi:NDP-sugar pyrophosphorylase family protein